VDEERMLLPDAPSEQQLTTLFLATGFKDPIDAKAHQVERT
jgi:hypothetical protein